MEQDESEKGKEIDLSALTSTQKKLTEIWVDILRNRNFSPADNFFDAGGTSLLAIRILNRIKESLGYSMTFKGFITNPTVIESGNYIDSQVKPEGKAIELVAPDRHKKPSAYNEPAADVADFKTEPDIASYIISFTFRFSGPLHLDIFRETLEITFNRHPTLFSEIREAMGEPYCDVVPRLVDISFSDFTGISEDEKYKKVRDILNSDARKIFDLENGPLYRIYLMQTRQEEYFFRFSVHHIIFDGWSWSVIVNDLNEVYNLLLKGAKVKHEPIGFQQYDYAQWEKNNTGSKDEEELREFWRENLKGSSPVIDLPYDFQRSEHPSGKGQFESLRFSPKLLISSGL